MKVAAVEKRTSKAGNKFYSVRFESGTKSTSRALFIPDGSRAYNPSSGNAIDLENFLNYTVNAGIKVDSPNYVETLVNAINLLDTPAVFEGMELKIQVGYTKPHIVFVERGKFKLVDRKGEPLLGIETTYPTRDAAMAAVEAINSKRDEPLEIQQWAEVVKFLPPDTPNRTAKVVKKDVQLNQGDDDDSDDFESGDAEGF